MTHRDGSPVWVSDEEEGGAVLSRISLKPKSTDGKYDERWLQELVHRHPQVLPIQKIDPGFEPLIPACYELPVVLGAGKSGYLDNLFVTRSGNLALVEVKLWRNPEARRQVIAQALDYAAAVFRLTYSEMDLAVSRARSAAGLPPASLFEIASEGAGELDEAEFVDGVTRHLQRGKAIVAVVGDGIREDLSAVAGVLQGHAAQRFTFALVELAIYATRRDHERLVVPSVLAQTVLLERAVIRIADSMGGPLIAVEPPTDLDSAPASAKGMTFGEDEFYEELARRNPNWPGALKGLADKAAALGVYTEMLGGLNFKHPSPAGNPFNLAAITKAGLVDFAPSAWWGNKDAARAYCETVAKLAGGGVVERKGRLEFGVRLPGNKMPTIASLLPDMEQEWLDAMEKYIRECLNPSGMSKAEGPDAYV